MTFFCQGELNEPYPDQTLSIISSKSTKFNYVQGDPMCWMTGAFLKTEQLVTRCSRLQTGRSRRFLCKLHFYLMTSLSFLRTGCRSDDCGDSTPRYAIFQLDENLTYRKTGTWNHNNDGNSNLKLNQNVIPLVERKEQSMSSIDDDIPNYDIASRRVITV